MKRGEKVRLDRKGLSPLVATVLLIAFAVALGTMIMNWSIGGEEEPELCDQLSLALQELPSGEAICYDTQAQSIRFLVKNEGKIEIEGFTLRVVDVQLNIEEKNIQAGLKQGEISKYELPYETLSPNKISAAILPRITNEHEEAELCVEQEIEIQSVPLC